MGEGSQEDSTRSTFKERWYRIIFHSDRFGERLFDVLLIVVISLSVLAVMLESVQGIRLRYGVTLYRIEWGFTILFTIEYLMRIYVSPKPLHYMRSPLGVVDLVSILPTYLDLLLPGAHYLMLFRTLRVLRVFRVLKMAAFLGESAVLYRAIRASGRKITIFVFWVVTLVIILGSIMYLIEGPRYGFSSIPKSVYWAIVTLTTVGYGDISPQTPLGQFIASIIMITGYGIIAVPTGIVTAEIAFASRDSRKYTPCPNCGTRSHPESAEYCYACGAELSKKL